MPWGWGVSPHCGRLHGERLQPDLIVHGERAPAQGGAGEGVGVRDDVPQGVLPLPQGGGLTGSNQTLTRLRMSE